MDDVVHCLTKHDVRYGEFSTVHLHVLGENAMNGKFEEEEDDFVLKLIERNRRCHDIDADTLSESYFGFKSVKEIAIQQLCDKMYCYLVKSYDIAARLSKDGYTALDSKLGLKQKPGHGQGDDDEKDIESLVKEKDIASYVGTKHFPQYAALLSADRKDHGGNGNENGKKFYLSFNVKDLETRIDPRELNTKRAKDKKEKKRREKAEVDCLKKLRSKKEKEDAVPAVLVDDAPALNAQETAVGGADDEQSKEAKPAEIEEKKEEKEQSVSVASPAVLPPKVVQPADKKEFSFGVRFN